MPVIHIDAVEISDAPAVSLKTAVKVWAAPLPAAGVTEVLVTTGTETVHEPSCFQPLEPAFPSAEIQTCFAPLYAGLRVTGIESTRVLELGARLTPAPSNEHWLFWTV